MSMIMNEIKGSKVKSTASEYLKHRSYEIDIDVSDDQDERMKNLKEAFVLAEDKVGLKEIVSPSSPNSFTFSTTSSQYNFIDQQYIRLKTWMTEASEPCRSELSQILFPLFVHLYLDLLTGAGKQAAKFFFSRHHQVFRVNRDYEQTLKQVWSAAAETGTSPIIQNLKGGKYLVKLSEVTLNYFLKYLQTSSNPTLLQIFNNFLEVEMSDAIGSSLHSTNDVSEEIKSNLSNKFNKRIDCSLNDLTQVEEVIRNVREMKPLMPSLSLYSVHNAYNGLTCSKINRESNLLFCGFEDSVIKIWRLVPPSITSQTDSIIGGKEILPSSSMRRKEPDGVLFCDTYAKSNNEHPSHAGCSSEETEENNDEDEIKGLGSRHVSGGEFCVLRGHRGAVFDAAFTHCSSYLLSVGNDTSMKLWDIDNHSIIALYYGHNYPIWCLDVSQHSIYIATGSYDQTARLWSTEFTHPLRTFVGHCGSVDSVSFHPNCNYVASGSSDKSVRLWQVSDASVARVLMHHQDSVRVIRFSPNGKYLASGAEDGQVLIWDLTAGKVLHQINGHDSHLEYSCSVFDSVVSLDWSSDSKVLYSASSNGLIKVTYLRSLDSNDTSEIGNLQCEVDGSSCSLLHASLSSHNFLQAVVVAHGER